MQILSDLKLMTFLYYLVLKSFIILYLNSVFFTDIIAVFKFLLFIKCCTDRNKWKYDGQYWASMVSEAIPPTQRLSFTVRLQKKPFLLTIAVNSLDLVVHSKVCIHNLSTFHFISLQNERLCKYPTKQSKTGERVTIAFWIIIEDIFFISSDQAIWKCFSIVPLKQTVSLVFFSNRLCYLKTCST